jgi:hypothetical protein
LSNFCRGKNPQPDWQQVNTISQAPQRHRKVKIGIWRLE